MDIDTDKPAGDNHPGAIAGTWRKLARNYRAHRAPWRSTLWLAYGLASLNLVLIAFFVFDAPLGQAARNLPPRLISIAGAVTDVGRLISLLVVLCAVFAVTLMIALRLTDLRRRFRIVYFCRITAYVFASLLSASAVVHVVKYAIGRARPLLYDQYGILGFKPFDGDFLFQSFPSAHSAHAGAFFTALALLFPRFRLFFLSLALWLGMTRVIVGVHYPSDVTAGLALGAFCALATATLFARAGWLFLMDANGLPRPRLTQLGTRRRRR